MTEVKVDLKDNSDATSSIVHQAEIYISPLGTLVIDLYRHGENISIGGVVIEQWEGDLNLRLWVNGGDDEPEYKHNFSDDHPDFCMKCGEESCEHGA